MRSPFVILLISVSLLMMNDLPGMGASILPPEGDTARMNALAREIRQMVADKSITAKTDSLLDEAFKMTSRKTAATKLLHWAAAEVAFARKEYGKAYEEAALAVNTIDDRMGPESKGKLMIFYAATCQYTGQFKISLEVLEKTVDFARANHVRGLLPKTYLAMSEVYKTVGNPEQILSSLSRMLEAARMESDKTAEQMSISRLGKTRLSYKWDFKTADGYLRQALSMAETLKDTAAIALTLTDLGWNFYLDKKPDSSLVYYEKAVKWSIEGNRPYTLGNACGNIGTIYRDLKQYDKARKFWEKGIETARSISDWYTQSWIYEDMSKMAANLGDYRNAYEYQQLYKIYSDSLAKQQNTEGLTMARAKFDADAVKGKVELLSLKLKNQKLLLYGVSAFLLLTVVIGLLLLRQSKINAKRRISEMDQKILEVTQANLRQQMNPHFIFNTLNSIQYYMYKHDKLATNNYLTKFSSLIRKILENSQHTAVPIRDELDALQLYLELESIRFRDKFDYEIRVDDEIDPLMYKIPTMLIQPYVENAICHGLMYREKKGTVKIGLDLGKDCLVCTIEDNGIGREASRELRKNKEKTHNSLGTRITESRLNLVNSLYGTSLKTTFTDLKDGQGNAAGTRVEIHIPILT